MKVFLFTLGYDQAGQLFALREAIRAERPTWTVAQMARKSKWLAYPADRDFDPAHAAQLWAEADVVHVTEFVSLSQARLHGTRAPSIYRAFPHPRALVAHHHGSDYRDDRATIDAICQTANVMQVVSTLDLLGSPGVEWLPVVADLDCLATLRRPRRAGSTVTIAHAPTDREQKGTHLVLAAIERLHDRGLPIEFDLIENVTWAECLERKGRADILVDQLTLGYGLNAVEAWAMGIPVVSGMQDPETRRRMLDMFGELPFVEATAETLADRLAELVMDIRLRREWGQRGRAHAERFHSQVSVVDRLDAIYSRSLAVAA